MGFCWRSLVTFCRYWQKVTRRRQKSMLSEAKKKPHLITSQEDT